MFLINALDFFYAASRELLLGILAVTISLTLVITLLIVNIFRRKQAEKELKKYRDHLEERVKERTAELEGANTHLQKEITDREQAEKALVEEHLLLRTVIDNLPDYIFVKDTQGRFILNNLAHAHILGAANPDELIGKAEADFFPKELAEQYHATDQEVIQSGQPVFNREEWITDPNGKKQWLLSTKIPLRDNQEIIGLVGINRDNTERKRAEDTYQQHTRELNLLNHMGNLLQACDTEEDAYGVMGSICKLLFPFDSGYMGITKASRSELNVVVSWGEPQPDTQTFGVSDCWALRLDTTHFIEHPDTGLLCTHLDVSPDDGYLCSPVSTLDDTLGIFHLRFGPFDAIYSNDERRQMKDAKRMMVTRVVRHYALFIINLRLRETLKREAIRDPLTGLYNRRHMEASLEREAHRAERLHTPVGLVMLDVDHFKLFNDTYGHEAGDVVLRELGNLLRTSIRGEDIACRYGGEEFLLILPDASLDSVIERAEEIRVKVKDLRIAYQNEELSVTLSAGIAMLPNHGPGIDDALKAADEALYKAKDEGRDRVEIASS